MTWAPAVALVMSPIAFIGSACFLGIEFHQAYSSGLIEYVSEFWNWIQVQPRDHATHAPYSPHVTQPYHLTIRSAVHSLRVMVHSSSSPVTISTCSLFWDDTVG